mgnify:CR=1 FL=1
MSESPEMRVSDLGVTRLFGVKGKTILVTGGARGIGLMIAAGFVANGATVRFGRSAVASMPRPPYSFGMIRPKKPSSCMNL